MTDAAGALREWLLDGPAQQRHGREHGAVAGALAPDGRAAYVYGEITGYYLHWLASPHLPPDPRRRPAAHAAAAWVERRYTTGPLPPTRIHLHDDATRDWRNDAQFFFDLAMLVGGLTAATRAALLDPPERTLHALLTALAGFVDHDGTLRPLRTEPGAAPPPPRWSTRGGPFLTKAAARVLDAAALVPLPPPLALACARHLTRHRPDPARAFDHPLHPTLYFLEGHLASPGADRAAATAVLTRLLARSDQAGTLPESLDTATVRRSDVMAQALRLGLLLHPHEPGLDRTAAALAARVRADGAIPFDPAARPRQLNVWSAMFAEQALSWHQAHSRHRARSTEPPPHATPGDLV
ncbi:hypothetical protein ACIQOW_30760 [Kitasatospora sp. NPDC091335]|uniref:hypothetical protein n=1 Tax=Kitasatospora sp. NPDC091335 TaxID=3364085 RepID=UPI003808C220